MKIGYLLARIVFGGWFLFSGIEFFTPLNLQPIGTTPLAREFTLALIHSGLFAWIKVMEIVVGGLVLINRGILPATLACLPLTAVIAYWNFVLEPGTVEISFGLLTVLLNLVLLWPYRARILALAEWKTQPARA